MKGANATAVWGRQVLAGVLAIAVAFALVQALAPASYCTPFAQQHRGRAAPAQLLDPSRLTKTDWSEGIAHEEQFWRRWFSTQGAEWPDDYANRMRLRPLDQTLRALTPQSALARGVVRVLDAGAGPATSIGTVWDARMRVELTAADALAPLYQKMYRDYKVTLPVPTTVAADFEEIAGALAGRHFDIVHVRNALDHSYNPILGIASMLEVVSPDCGVLFLTHAVGEGSRMAFQGFHKWDFLVENNNFVITRPGVRYDASVLFAPAANVTAKIVEDKIEATFTKRSPGGKPCLAR